ALEVGDLEEALRFWGSLFDIRVSREPEYRMAFVDLGDQFIALSEGRSTGPDSDRHFGLVVDDKEAVRDRLRELGVQVSPGRRLNFRDPSGNLIQVVEYGQIQFTKADSVLRGMGLADLSKTAAAEAELAEKGLL
ncbi:MAG TPA: VOC family protein, partial [Thermoleophilaceae bacterium]|nr:VOC family protein [Thermoleophilaceae bacterium]